MGFLRSNAPLCFYQGQFVVTEIAMAPQEQEQEPLLLKVWRLCSEFAAEHNISYVPIFGLLLAIDFEQLTDLPLAGNLQYLPLEQSPPSSLLPSYSASRTPSPLPPSQLLPLVLASTPSLRLRLPNLTPLSMSLLSRFLAARLSSAMLQLRASS